MINLCSITLTVVMLFQSIASKPVTTPSAEQGIAALKKRSEAGGWHSLWGLNFRVADPSRFSRGRRVWFFLHLFSTQFTESMRISSCFLIE